VFRVVVEREARDNIRDLFRDLKERDPGSGYPVRWLSGIQAAITDLAVSAERHGPAYEDRFFTDLIRHRLYESYKILFTIRDDRVHVLHVRHQRQDSEDARRGP
jgi:plasmid stabilization system protein ParE